MPKTKRSSKGKKTSPKAPFGKKGMIILICITLGVVGLGGAIIHTYASSSDSMQGEH